MESGITISLTLIFSLFELVKLQKILGESNEAFWENVLVIFINILL